MNNPGTVGIVRLGRTPLLTMTGFVFLVLAGVLAGPVVAQNPAGASAAAGQNSAPLTLADCYRIAEQNQPELAAAQAAVEASEARLRQRHSAYLPRLDAGAGHTQST